MHHKLIQKGRMCNLVLEKDLDLAKSGSFYCDYTHLVGKRRHLKKIRMVHSQGLNANLNMQKHF
jgi:hypothetical protein